MVGISLVVTNLLHDKITKGKMLYIGIYFGLVILGIASIFKISETRCWNTSPDCESNIEEAQLISLSTHPLLITDFNKFGLMTFLAVINESKAKNVDIMYCKGSLPDIKGKIKDKAYSEIYIFHSSDTLAQEVKSQFGERMMPYKKDVSIFSPQIWQIKL